MNENVFKYDVVIIGGGAAGLAAAAAFGRRDPDARLAVLEKEKKPGKKLLATGNGRCNLTNFNMTEESYNFTARPFVKALISRVTPQRLIDSFEKLGLLCRGDTEGRVYPYSNQASAVLGTLLLHLKKNGTDVICETKVNSVKNTNGGWLLDCGDKSFFCKTLILSTGGAVQKALGSDGSSYELARRLSLDCSPVFPSLAPVNVTDKHLPSVKGVRTQAIVSAVSDGKTLCFERGELQLNEKNISGICVFQISRYINEYFALGTVRGKKYREVYISADLAPDHSEEEIAAFLQKRKNDLPDADASELFTGLINKKLTVYLMKKCGVAYSGRKIRDISAKELSALSHAVKICKFTPCKMSSYDQAQVTAGGISLSEIDRNMRSVRYKNLYIVGEALDVDGICGGYNLHFAFASGITAGAHAAKNEVKKNDKDK